MFEKKYLTVIPYCALFIIILFAPAARAQDASFSWIPNTETTLAGYKIHYGTAQGTYTEVTDVGNPPIGDDNRIHGSVFNLTEGTTYYFVCTAYDDQGNESEYSQEIEWTATGQTTDTPPVAENGSISTNENQAVTGTLTASSDADLPITYQIQQNVSHGTLDLTPTSGAFTYTPTTNFSGADSFTFTASDDNGTSDPATVTITVSTVNHPPQATGTSIDVDGNAGYSGQLQGSDPDGDQITFSRVSAPTKGNVTIDDSGNFTYTSNNNQTGTDSFTFKVNDGKLDSNPATVSINITAVNHPPTVTNGTFATSKNNPVSGLLRATDPDNDTLSYNIVSNGSLGTASITNAQTGAFTYTPNTDATGTDSFTFKANDGTLSSGAGTISITIAQNNQIPVAHASSFSGTTGSVISGHLDGSDPDGDPLTFSLVKDPNKGTLTLDPSGQFSYTPDQNTIGIDTFTFKVNDGTDDSASAQVTITINDSQNSVQFRWTPNQEQIDGYRLYYKIDDTGGPEYNGTGINEGDSPVNVGNVTQFKLTGLQENKRYYFTITAYKGDEESTYSKEIVLWTGKTPPAPTIMNIIEVK
ncbi:MAG TPA: tandem-95 repeat protein [Desulfobulbus sp.]|nr:tandem-95 repeat protein [Desulfobulbus sp.]